MPVALAGTFGLPVASGVPLSGVTPVTSSLVWAAGDCTLVGGLGEPTTPRGAVTRPVVARGWGAVPDTTRWGSLFSIAGRMVGVTPTSPSTTRGRGPGTMVVADRTAGVRPATPPAPTAALLTAVPPRSRGLSLPRSLPLRARIAIRGSCSRCSTTHQRQRCSRTWRCRAGRVSGWRHPAGAVRTKLHCRRVARCRPTRRH